MEYDFREIEKKWQRYWKENDLYKTIVDPNTPKYYVLEMFPYPSGAGLHVGHPLGYIAGDIYARYKRLKGFNVLHPMGYDAYGLPAEQYAIQTGQHPAITTEQNIKRYREQLDILGFSYDWSREVRTCDPEYYKWTQWAFIQMFNSYYCYDAQQARPVAELIEVFNLQGSAGLNVACGEELFFSAEEWKAKTEKEQQEILLNYRLAYLADTMVNWCPALGTVLANDEVVNGVSVRGGHPVERKLMKQWSLRITAYAQRPLDGLDKIEWSDSLKEIQRNWIGRSEGGSALFSLTPERLSQKPQNINRKGRKELTQGTQSFEFKEFPLCALCVKPLRPCGKNADYGYVTTDGLNWHKNIEKAKDMRKNSTEAGLEIFTTRPDTIFGVTFMVVCPEYDRLDELTTEVQRQEVEEYVS
jgi:leucyl-tRNA synthetase